jgi:hypothetical protein
MKMIWSRLGEKVCLIEKRADSHLGDDIRFEKEKKKVNAHGREKTLKFGAVEINFKWRTNI